MELKHTKGEWIAKQLELSGNWIVKCRHSIICKLNSQHTKSSLEANAKLIAAAPELLEALIGITKTSCSDDMYDIAQEAINKATK